MTIDGCYPKLSSILSAMTKGIPQSSAGRPSYLSAALALAMSLFCCSSGFTAVLYQQIHTATVYELYRDAGAGVGSFSLFPFWSGSGPLFPGVGGFTLARDARFLRVKSRFNGSCSGIANVRLLSADGSLIGWGNGAGEASASYCDLPLAGASAGTRVWAVLLCGDPDCTIPPRISLDGSPSNPGFVVDGSQTRWQPGGWAFKLCDSGGCLEGLNWSQRSPDPSPSPRATHAMAFDGSNQGVLLFGGSLSNDGSLSNETWSWDGASWTRLAPVDRPTPRSFPAIAYDAARREIVLFGGLVDSTPVADTWVWDGTNWEQRFPAHRPPPRYTHGMAYDEVREQLVLFGGVGADGYGMGDTWIWNGEDWIQKAPVHSPSPRYYTPLAYDSIRHETVLFGGFSGGSEWLSNETWVWDGSDWSERSPLNGPPPTRRRNSAHWCQACAPGNRPPAR